MIIILFIWYKWFKIRYNIQDITDIENNYLTNLMKISKNDIKNGNQSSLNTREKCILLKFINEEMKKIIPTSYKTDLMEIKNHLNIQRKRYLWDNSLY